MTTSSFEALADAVVAASDADRWDQAVLEWQVVSVARDPHADGVCVCGQTRLVSLFTIENTRNGEMLFPIGSSCVNQFGRADLDRQVDLWERLLALRQAIDARQPIRLTTEYFSRAMLDHLYESGAFPPDEWNGGDGWKDYDFLLKMFNKRDKAAITDGQQRKIYMLLTRKVIPFVRSYDQLG
ncbi:hypothetical protein [Isoptericola sp. NPDC019482]|uniref:hypothetical protein n=1 Tax=Isoptericola sp. NPDC019482 TaxID=3154688 RepID=UPI0034920228